MSTSVSRRAIFYIGGYDPKSPDAFYQRLSRETGRFEALWDVEVAVEATKAIGEDVTFRRSHSSGDGWETVTDFHFLTLDDIVLKDFSRPFLVRLGRSLLTTGDYFLSGTAFGFLRHAWRFFLYFFYPIAMQIIAFLVSVGLAWMIARSGVALAGIVSIVVFLATFSAFVQLVWKRRHVLHLMDLWSFSRDFLRQSRRDIEDKLDNFARLAVTKVQNENYDEVIFVGHSTGGALILDVAGRAAEIDPQLGQRARAVTVLTVGSTALKIGLHPAAGWFVERVRNLFADRNINWIEYQCHTDAINFYKTDPAVLMGLSLEAGIDNQPRPLTRQIRIKDMVSGDTYQRIKRNFFRIHYQFVFGNTKEYHYDFPAICFGPASVLDRAANGDHFMGSILPSKVSDL